CETWSNTRLLWRKLGSAVFPCNKYVYLGKVGIVTEPLLMKSIQSQVISAGDKPDLLPTFCLISPPNGAYAKRDGGSTCHICGNTIFEGLIYADIQNPRLGNMARPRTSLGALAATLLIGGSISEASAKSHPHPRRHHHQASNSSTATSGRF